MAGLPTARALAALRYPEGASASVPRGRARVDALLRGMELPSAR